MRGQGGDIAGRQTGGEQMAAAALGNGIGHSARAVGLQYFDIARAQAQTAAPCTQDVDAVLALHLGAQQGGPAFNGGGAVRYGDLHPVNSFQHHGNPVPTNALRYGLNYNIERKWRIAAFCRAF